MAAYKADIEIGVVGVGKLGALHKSLNQLANAVDIVNNKQIGKGLNVQNLVTYNAQLERASNLLSKVAAGIPEETAAVKTYVTALLQSNAARERQNTLIQQEIALRNQAARIAALPAPVATPSQYAQPAGPVATPGTGLAAAMQTAGMPTFAAGVRGIGQGLTPGKRAGTLKGAVGSAIIGGGFPMLFGQGPEAAIGGAVGGALGGLVGGPMGFALSIAGTALGEILAKQKELINEVRNEAIARGQAFTAVDQQLKSTEQQLELRKKINELDGQIAQAAAEGNDKLVVNLELQKELESIESERLEKIRKAAQDESIRAGEQFKQATDLINAEAEADMVAAQRAATQKQITAEYTAQVTQIRQELALHQGIIDIEQQRITQNASFIEARSQAEIAVNNVILQRLEYELQSATSAQERMMIIEEIYNVEVANARATYEATVARINAQTKLVELAVREQEAKRLALEVEKAIALQKNQDVRQLERAIQLQTQAVQLARENLSYTRAIAAEQLRGADATFRAAEQAARFKAETAAAAQAAAQYANNISAAVSASAPVSSGGGGGGGGGGGDDGGGNSASLAEYGGFTPLGAVKDFERRLQEYDELRSYGIKAEMPRIEGYLATEGRYFNKNYGALALSWKFTEADMEMRRILEIALAKYQAQNKDTTFTTPQVNIRTGPVMQMDGTNYVSQQDLVSATQTAARQGARMALGSLRSDPATRRSLGLAR